MFRKVIASVLAFTFLVQSVGFSQIQPLELSAVKSVQIEIPKEFGQIVSAPFAPSKSNFIIHIQDAHGSYEAQQNIENIISYLAEHYGIKTLFLEGGAGKLAPEQFHFFDDRKLDLKVADLLMKRGAFTGAEKFLLSGKAEGYGIEDISFYRDNFKLFESAVNAQPQADLAIQKLKTKTQNQLNQIFSKDARDFVKAWEIHQGENSDWMRYLFVLNNAAQKHLKLDLRNPENQIDFPMLVRYFNLKNRNVDAGKAASERKVFLGFLKGKISANLHRQLSHFEENENPRSLFESLQDEISKKQIKLPEFQNFIRYAGNRMLQSEMKSKELFTEMNQLSARIFNALLKTPEEKEILKKIRERILLEKLAHLALTREEWKQVPSREGLTAKQGGVLNPSINFYRAAEKRESAFLKNIEATAKKNKVRSAILVTGGFHAEGLDSGLKQLGYSVITIHPNFKDTENSRKNYLGAMLPETSQLARALELNLSGTLDDLAPRWSTVYRHERDAAVQEIADGASLGSDLNNEFAASDFLEDLLTLKSSGRPDRKPNPGVVEKIVAYGPYASVQEIESKLEKIIPGSFIKKITDAVRDGGLVLGPAVGEFESERHSLRQLLEITEIDSRNATFMDSKRSFPQEVHHLTGGTFAMQIFRRGGSAAVEKLLKDVLKTVGISSSEYSYAFEKSAIHFLLADGGKSFAAAVSDKAGRAVSLSEVEKIHVYLHFQETPEDFAKLASDDMVRSQFVVKLKNGKYVSFTLRMSLKNYPVRDSRLIPSLDQNNPAVSAPEAVVKGDKWKFISKPFQLKNGDVVRYVVGLFYEEMGPMMIKGYNTSNYDSHAEIANFVSRARAAGITAMWWQPVLRDFAGDERVLELAAGDGRAHVYFNPQTQQIERLPEALQRKIVSTDILSSALETVKKRHPGIETLQSDWLNIPKPAGKIRMVIGMNALSYIPVHELEGVIKRLEAILDPSSDGKIHMNFLVDVPPTETEVYSATEGAVKIKGSTQEMVEKTRVFVERWKSMIRQTFERLGYDISIDNLNVEAQGAALPVHQRFSPNNVLSMDGSGGIFVNRSGDIPSGHVKEVFSPILIRASKVKAAEGASLGQRGKLLLTRREALAALIGFAAGCVNSPTRSSEPRQQTESVQPETAPVVSARPAVERPAPREFVLRDRPGRRDQIHGWMKSNQIEVDIFRQPRMAISFRTNRPRTIWVQFKNSLRQDLVQSPGGGDLRVDLPDTQGQFQTIELNLRDNLVPGIIDTEAVIEIILGDENARPVEINPIMYEAADGKSLGQSKASLDELAQSYRETLRQSLRRVVLWEGWGLWQWYAWLFLWDQVEEARQKFSGKNLMSPRRWIGSAVVELNWMENGLKNETSIVFSEVSKMHHRLLRALKRSASEDEYGFSAAYRRMTDQIYWDTILQKHDSRIEREGERDALIPVSDIRDYIYLVRRVIPGLSAGEDKTDSISAASLGRTTPTARQLEIRFDEICDLLVNAKKYKRANSSLKEIILERIESVDAALRNAQLFEAAQKLRKLVINPEFREVMPETFILNAQKFIKEMERLTIPKDIIDWLRRGLKKKERYSAERLKTFDEILQKNYKNLLGEQLVDQMWRSIASALFGGRHDEILPLDEESYEFDLHDVFSSEIGWIPRANRYITQMLMTAVINGSFQKVISAALYLEDQTEEIKKAAFAGGYGPMVWASVLHHYAMLAIYEKNFQRPSSPPTAASSLGSEKIKIPGSVWVPVEIIESYTNQTQFERDLADGFFRRDADGSLWAPVIRDPSILHPDTIHGRSIHFETRVIKGSGLQEAVKGVPYSYDPHNVFESAKFRGGETKLYSHHAALSALKIRAAYEEALLEKDPAILLAKEKYGTKEEPVLKPLYLVRPLKIPVFRFGSTELLDAAGVLREMKVPEQKIKQQAIFIYETPLNDRLNEISRFNKDFANVPAVYGNPKDSAEILKIFAARLALANYLMHERLNGTFTAEYEDAEDFPPFVSSLDFHNITAAGYIVDLDTVETEWKEKSPKKLQARDEKLARDAIKYFAGKINIPKEIGYQVYDEVRSAGKSTKTEASSLGAASDLVGGETNLRYLQRIREIVTAGRDPQKKTIALYPGSGADISTALLATDADEFIFVDKMIFDLPGYAVTEEEKKKYTEEYLNQKAQTNYALAVTIEAMKAIKPFLEKELQILGAQDVRISARKETDNVFDVEFVWNERPRKITFVSGADMRFLPEYQDYLPKNGKVDFVIIKAGQYRTFLHREIPRNAQGRLNPAAFPKAVAGGLAGVVIEENGFVISDNPAAAQFSFVQSGVLPVEDARLKTLESEYEADFGYDKAYLFRKTAAASSLGKYVLDHPEEKLAQDALGSLINMRFIIPEGMIARVQQNFEQLNEMVKARFPEDSQSLQVIYLDASRHIENMKSAETMRFDHLASIWESLEDYLIEYQNISEDLYEGDALDVLEFAVQADMERIEKIFPQFLELRLPNSENGIAVMALVDPKGNLYPATPEKWTFGNLISRERPRKLNSPEEIFTYMNQGWSVIFFPTAIDVEELSPSMLMSVHFEASSLGAKLEVARVYTNKIIFMPGVSKESLKSTLKTLGLFNEKAVNVLDARTAVFNQNLGPVLEYLGIYGESLKGVPVILEDSVYRNQTASKEIAVKLSGAMRDKDLLAVDWDQKKPAFVPELRQAANNRFQVKDIQRKVFTDSVLKQWTRRFDVAPIWIGTVGEENAVQISFSSGDKIKLNLEVLHQNGIDPTQVVALLRQIAAQPDKRQELFSRAGFTKSANGWEVGQNFVSLLLNKIYADQAAQRSVQAAA